MGFSNVGIACVAADLGFSRRFALEPLPTLTRAPFKAAERQLAVRPTVSASVLAGPALEVVRVCMYYTLMQTGVAVQSAKLKGGEELLDDTSSPGWLEKLLNKDTEADKAKSLSKLRKNWHASTKGTLIRKYRVPSKAEGRKCLHALGDFLSEGDNGFDASTHKGCQIRRENAHAESVCCNNVRALFDELPTPHLVIEITVFPPGPITDVHWEKVEKLENVIKKANSI